MTALFLKNCSYNNNVLSILKTIMNSIHLTNFVNGNTVLWVLFQPPMVTGHPSRYLHQPRPLQVPPSNAPPLILVLLLNGFKENIQLSDEWGLMFWDRSRLQSAERMMSLELRCQSRIAPVLRLDIKEHISRKRRSLARSGCRVPRDYCQTWRWSSAQKMRADPKPLGVSFAFCMESCSSIEKQGILSDTSCGFYVVHKLNYT